MTNLNIKLSIVAVSLLSLVSLNVQAEDKEITSVTTTTSQTPEGNTIVKEVKRTTRVVTPVPAAKETVATPQGYVSCFNVEEGWVDDVWVPTHRVCQYENTSEGSVWVEGYWRCSKVTTEGACTVWDWRAGHWEKKLVVY